jgi:phosphatidylethanolamine/phosphatidyl-N-methylethanolamine N-methyltransferase
LDIEAVRKSYRRYAERYDFYFGAVFQPGRKAIVDLMAGESGEHILEVGVGTGLSLPLYPRHVQITGIDVSADMLEKAHARVQTERLDNAILHEMDAEAMTFPDNSFDKVVAMYVASVVPNPKQLVAEMQRVCKPGGELFIVNHFLSRNWLLARAEKTIAPLSNLMGFHPDFELPAFIRETELDVVEQVPVNFLGYWTLLRAGNQKPSEPVQAVAYEPLQMAASR